MIMFRKKKAIERGKAWKEVLEVSDESDYNIGMYNGIERMLAVLEGRTPKYIIKIPASGDVETEPKRTKITGIRRLR